MTLLVLYPLLLLHLFPVLDTSKLHWPDFEIIHGHGYHSHQAETRQQNLSTHGPHEHLGPHIDLHVLATLSHLLHLLHMLLVSNIIRVIAHLSILLEGLRILCELGQVFHFLLTWHTICVLRAA